MESVFWGGALGVVYTYFGYPILLWLLSRVRNRPIAKSNIRPTVSVIIAAYNEAASIERKLDCLLAQSYISDIVEIIVASDGSTDDTDDLVIAYAGAQVRLMRVEGRLGKTAVQNQAAEVARGDILVFTDATTHLDADAVQNLLPCFADPRVGCVSGHVTYINRTNSGVGSGGKSYWGYERTLKQLESSLGSLTGATGCFYAVRSSVYVAIPPELISDFMVALNTFERGYRSVYEFGANSYEDTLDSSRREFGMRVRVAVRTLSALWRKKHLLNPLRHGLFAIQLISHKVLRYLVPVFLLVVFLANIALVDVGLYIVTLWLQGAFYAAAGVGHFAQRSGVTAGLWLWSKPYYFALANLAALVALIRFLRGDRIVTWQPIR